jgi:hypothetical protein
MRSAQYRRVIEGTEGRWWHLPHAEYTCLANNWTTAQIRDEVRGIAERHHNKARVFVTKSADWAASGLRRVTADDPEPDDT